MTDSAREWLERIHALPRPTGATPLRVMNVCGGHERTLSMSGMRTLLPDYIELIPGPGCPVCICPEEDVSLAIDMAMQHDITLLTFGDMLRVPVNISAGEQRAGRPRTLAQAAASGADVHPIASPLEAIMMARQNPARRFIFFAVGFETTMAPIAAMLDQGLTNNLLLLLSGRRTWPAVAALMSSGDAAFDALIAPGHVATIMGSDEWQFVTDQYRLPCAVAGFTSETLLAAIYSVLRQQHEQRCFLDNCYPELVTTQGNPSARTSLERQLDIGTAAWRGLGEIPASGYDLKPHWQDHDARLHYPPDHHARGRHERTMPPGCDCARVVCGQIFPDQCRLYGTHCTPATAVGPCMVSDEGACHIWWQAGKRRHVEKDRVTASLK